MSRQTHISFLRIIQLLFIVACIYYWVLIPIVGEVLYFVAGRDTAESVKLSLGILQPADILFMEPERVPSDLYALLLYYLKPVSSLAAFAVAGCFALFVRRKRYVTYTAIVLAVSVLMWLVGGYIGYGIFAFVAALSGIGVAIILRPNTALEPTPTAP
jgi:O-antigen ligase